MTENIFDVKLIPFIIILSGALLCCIGITIFTLFRYKRLKKTQPEKTHKAAALLWILPSLVAVVIIANLITTGIGYKTAVDHGLYTTDISVAKMFTGIEKSPIPDKYDETKAKGKILLFYKFGCNDCEAIYDDLSKTVSDADVLWISTRSDTGKKLVEEYKIEEVPSGVYVRENAYNDALPYTKKLLYTVNADGETKFDKTAIDRLLYLQSEKR